LNFDLSTPQITSHLGYLAFIHFTKFEHYGIIHLWVMLWQTNSKQSDKQSDGAERPTHADRQSLINKILQVQSDLKA